MYIVKMFDGLQLPEYIQRGDTQDLGTGAALTSFLPLPGGGFYDNYRSRTSPQGIRPISKSGLFWGTDAELHTYLDDWRAKLGRRGRLVLEFDDGSTRWQWARLQDVSTPRPSNAKGGWLPFALTWITAAQNWRGIVHDEGWTWGDDSWTFGDGSTEFGVGAISFTVTTSGTLCTVPHTGSINAPNVRLKFDLTGSWEDLRVINQTTGQQIIIDRASPASTAYVEIDAGSHAIYTGDAPVVLSGIYRHINTLYVLAGVHGLSTGETARIEGTGIYDGDYYPVTVTDVSNYNAPYLPLHTGYGTVATGTSRRLVDAYDVTTFSDRERWLVLAPGDNILQVIWNDAPTSATMTVEYVDHYA